ncbi:hypothetical protein, partial [Dyadobacter frigoris]|uniref:hypothetical protein n=1 Tax=Dyadobacter frigoris TaxID=2576211 RepID=UPI00255293FD
AALSSAFAVKAKEATSAKATAIFLMKVFMALIFLSMANFFLYGWLIGYSVTNAYLIVNTRSVF